MHLAVNNFTSAVNVNERGETSYIHTKPSYKQISEVPRELELEDSDLDSGTNSEEFLNKLHVKRDSQLTEYEQSKIASIP